MTGRTSVETYTDSSRVRANRGWCRGDADTDLPRHSIPVGRSRSAGAGSPDSSFIHKSDGAMATMGRMERAGEK